MKIHVGHHNPDPFKVPAGNYRAKLLRYRQPNQPHSSCPIHDQFDLDFQLDNYSGIDYIATAHLCTSKRCSYGPRSIAQFLYCWLGDRYYDFRDEHGNIEMDALVLRRGDAEICTEYHDPHYPKPYSRLKAMYPVGHLLD